MGIRPWAVQFSQVERTGRREGEWLRPSRGLGRTGQAVLGLRETGGSAGTGGGNWRVPGRGLEWGRGGGPRKPLDWSSVGGLWGDRIDSD